MLLISWHPAVIFSSPESKTQVSFSDQNLSLVVVVVVNFSHFRLLLQNHWANFKRTYHHASLGEGDSSLLNEGPALFQGKIIVKYIKYIAKFYTGKSSSPDTEPISTKLSIIIHEWREFKFFKWSTPIQREIILK